MIDEKSVFIGVDVDSFDECMDFISKKAYDLGISNDYKKTKLDLLKREEEMNTALLEPLAIPHTKSDSINRSDFIFIRLNNSIDWNGSRVKIIIALFSKENDNVSHIELLAKISRKLVDEDFRKSLEVDSKQTIVKKIKDIMEVS
ncbi:MAG: PTS sugar transporter subunit IIA [Tissierellia bacterium]|nr:PTS sugar transporter subunit IIA [Tissierellia bacterium]